MSEEKGVFRFELNETLYFESGQEVAEIIGISLDPEISIQTFNEYISIRGVIELSGDYHKVQLPDKLDDEPYGMDEYHEKNFIEQVVDKTDTHAAFVHRFPVEISIPSYRVNDLDEVTVQVAFFDYEIPNHHQMKLMATIEIDGLIEQEQETNDESEASDETEMPNKQEKTMEKAQNETMDEHPQEREEEENDDGFNEEPVNEAEKETVQTDKDNEVEKTQIDDNDLMKSKVDSGEKEKDQMEVEHNDDEREEKESPSPVQKDEKKSKKSLLLSDFFKTKESKDTDEDESMQEEPELDSSSTAEQSNDQNEEEQEEDEAIKTNEKGMENEQNQTPIHSLSDMFEHDTEDQYTKMRLCIVQDDDTIDTIAERYEITPNQLILKNRLNGDSISEGQLLYIPEKVSK